MARKPQIPLKDVMKAIDKKDRTFYNSLNDDQKKAFSAWMMMRYASSVQGRNAEHYILMVNELVNKEFSSLSKHPELQWLLLSSCGSGKVEFHPYIKPPNARKKKDAVKTELSKIYPTVKNDELDLLVNLNTKQELKELFQIHGYDDKSIGDILGKV